MKKITIILFILFISCNSKKEKNAYNLTANLENLDDSLIVTLSKYDWNNRYFKDIDSTFSLHNQFKFKGNINKDELFTITFKEKHNNNSVQHKYFHKLIFLYLDSSKINLTGDFNNLDYIIFRGSKLSELKQKYDAISKKFNNELKAKKISRNQYSKNTEEEQLKFLYHNPDNAFSLNEILDLNSLIHISIDSLNIFYSKISKSLRDSKNGIALYNFINLNKVKIGENFKDFSAKDLNGKILKLSEFKGKIILLDFWANWCHFCHEQNQKEFSKLKEKYKDDKFVIISYSVDLENELWLNSSKNDKINWINISNLQGVEDKVATLYNVHTYPTSFLIDQNGIVRYKFIGYNKGVIEKLLNELLAKTK